MRHDVCSQDGTALFVELWQRNRGGYTLAYTALWQGEWRPDAVQAKSIETAMDFLEAACQFTHHGDKISGSLHEAVAQIKQTAQNFQDIARFRQMVGLALDSWLDLAQQPVGAFAKHSV